jgi:hypothetical protein
VGKVLRVRSDGADEDIYLLTYVAAGGRAWLRVAARTSESPVSRLHAPPAGRGGPGARGARPSTFAGRGLSAVGSDGQRYTLGFSGGGGTWYLGRLTLSPTPPPGLDWLDITGGGQTVRADLTARTPEVTALVTHVAANRAETYLLLRAENLLSHPALAAAEAAGMASVVPALRAVGALSEVSPVPGQIAALCQRLGADGHAIAVPGELPDRWAALGGPAAPPQGVKGGLRKPPFGGSKGAEPPGKHCAAHLAGVLPSVDGVTITLAGLITRAGQGTTLFGAMRPRPDPDIRVGGPSLWLTGDDGWHTVSVSGWSTHGDGYTFQADVVPPLTPAVTEVEVRVTSPGTEARATLPLTWWKS